MSRLRIKALCVGSALFVSGFLYVLSPRQTITVRNFAFMVIPILAGLLLAKIVEIIILTRKK